MKLSQFAYYTFYGASQILTRSDKPLIGSIILTDSCNLSCLHCDVNNKAKIMYKYSSICRDMEKLFAIGVRILMLYGGEPFLWHDGDKNLRDLVIKAKEIGFFIVNIVTNGTYPLNVPEADTILVSLDGGKEKHDLIRGTCYDRIMQNIRNSSNPNICLYCALNKINKNEIRRIGRIAVQEQNVKAVSFNFHTPYPGTEYLSLTKSEKRKCCSEIHQLIKNKVPVFNSRTGHHTTFPQMPIYWRLWVLFLSENSASHLSATYCFLCTPQHFCCGSFHVPKLSASVIASQLRILAS